LSRGVVNPLVRLTWGLAGRFTREGPASLAPSQMPLAAEPAPREVDTGPSRLNGCSAPPAGLWTNTAGRTG